MDMKYEYEVDIRSSELFEPSHLLRPLIVDSRLAAHRG